MPQDDQYFQAVFPCNKNLSNVQHLQLYTDYIFRLASLTIHVGGNSGIMNYYDCFGFSRNQFSFTSIFGLFFTVAKYYFCSSEYKCINSLDTNIYAGAIISSYGFLYQLKLLPSQVHLLQEVVREVLLNESFFKKIHCIFVNKPSPGNFCFFTDSSI